jgi:hypothetical protein
MTANATIETVLGLIPASSNTVESEGQHAGEKILKKEIKFCQTFTDFKTSKRNNHFAVIENAES